jgi:hypothetical protein
MPGSKLDVSGDINMSGSLWLQGTQTLQFPGGLGTGNIGIGCAALQNNPTGALNSAGNIAIGYAALQNNNSSGDFNTAVGYSALKNNTYGGDNTAIGSNALSFGTNGGNNTAVGSSAMISGGGSNNTAVGVDALLSNFTGISNTAVGLQSLYFNTAGNFNTAVGLGALSMLGAGSNNTAIGYYAGGALAGSGSNNIHIGTQGVSTDNGIIRIGGNTNLGDSATQTQFFVSGVGGATVTGVQVLVNPSTGQLGVASSSRRYKEDIQDMGDSSNGLMRLRPVTFHYQKPFADGSKPIQYGLIAEEVAEVYPDLVAKGADGQIEAALAKLPQ